MKYFRSFRPFENFSKNRSRRDDSFGPKIVKIRAILAIFRPFKDFYLDFGGGGRGGLIITSLGYGAMISACEKGMRPELALGLFTTTEHHGVVPDVIIYSALISACEKGKQPE